MITPSFLFHLLCSYWLLRPYRQTHPVPSFLHRMPRLAHFYYLLLLTHTSNVTRSLSILVVFYPLGNRTRYQVYKSFSFPPGSAGLTKCFFFQFCPLHQDVSKFPLSFRLLDFALLALRKDRSYNMSYVYRELTVQ